MSVSGTGNTNRITGMFSGFDTDSMIKAMMLKNYAKFDRMTQQVQKAQWRRDAYTEISTSLRKFREEYASVLSKTNMLSPTTYSRFSITQSSSAYASVTASGTTADVGNHRIDYIERLASAAQFRSAGLSQGKDVTVGDVLGKGAGDPAEMVRIQINGHDLSFLSTTKLSDVARQINNHTIETQVTDSHGNFLDASGNVVQMADGTVVIPGRAIAVKTEKLGVVAKFSELDNSFSISSAATGEKQELKLSVAFDTGTGDASDVTAAAGERFLKGLFDGSATPQYDFSSAAGAAVKGTDAKLSIDGVVVTRDTNKFTADGLTYELFRAHNDINTAEPVTFKVDRDIEAAVTAVKDLVKGLNDLLAPLMTKLTETYDYKNPHPPLTDGQRGEMEEEDIELWEAEAKKGVLRRDPALGNLISQIRAAFSSNVGGKEENGKRVGGLGSLMSIGLDIPYTGPKEFKIEIDEGALRKALEEDPDRVASLFTQSETGSATGLVPAVMSAFDQYNTALDGAVDNSTGQRREGLLNSISNNIYELTENLKAEQTRLDAMESKLYLRFSAMETMLAALNDQATWVSQNMGGS